MHGDVDTTSISLKTVNFKQWKQDALNKPRMPGRDERQQESVCWFAHPFS